MLTVLGWGCLALGLIGTAYTLFAANRLDARSRRRTAAPAAPRRRPSVTILKPLHGQESELYANLESFCLQDYAGPVQIVFGVHDIGDAAVRTVRQLQRAYPARDISMVVDARLHGENRKVCNLMNMERAIRGELVVLSDSDIAVGPGYLEEVAAPLADPAAGFVTCLYSGRGVGTLWSSLSAAGINYGFLPNVLAGVSLGMAEPCFGATVALRRQVLAEVGGFSVLADQLADDYDLGRVVRAAGYRGEIAPTPVSHLCDERSWRELWRHEARWARTIRAIDPWGFLGSAITYPLAWASLGLVLAPSPAALAVLGASALSRLHLASRVNRATGVPPAGVHLLLVRDILSFAVFLSAFCGRSVSWRGLRYRIGADGALIPAQEPVHASHSLSSSPLLRRLRRRRRIALPGEARDQIVLVSDLARSAGGPGREQQADRRPAA